MTGSLTTAPITYSIGPMTRPSQRDVDFVEPSLLAGRALAGLRVGARVATQRFLSCLHLVWIIADNPLSMTNGGYSFPLDLNPPFRNRPAGVIGPRSEEQTSELQSLMRPADAV